MNSSGATAGLGLVSAASWGGSDFLGGLGARRAPALLVVASGHLFSLLVLLAICLAAHLALPGRHDLLFSSVAGFEGSVALALFYRALAMGAMGLTAALTGLLTALVPVLFSLAHDGLPTPLTACGLALGLAAIWLITHSPAAKGQQEKRAAAPPAALLLGALAGLGFGAQLILFKFAAGGGLLWVMTSARGAGVAAMLLVLLVLPPKAPWRGFWLYGILAGSLDTVGNLFYIQTTRLGRLDVAALVCSLYPAGTILLAALVLREWPTRRQFAGMALALAAVVLLSV
ncbi:MAG TPA: EamA family transporter [Terracidiphilus sp.]|nr:EamA family transporter [Terracidiphilus sp.]